MEYCENSDLREFINKKKKENQLIDQNNIIYCIKYMYRFKRNT